MGHPKSHESPSKPSKSGPIIHPRKTLNTPKIIKPTNRLRKSQYRESHQNQNKTPCRCSSNYSSHQNPKPIHYFRTPRSRRPCPKRVVPRTFYQINNSKKQKKKKKKKKKAAAPHFLPGPKSIDQFIRDGLRDSN